MKNGQRSEQLLRQVQEAEFVLHELVLYLDTHPEHRKAREAYREWQKKRSELVLLYEQTVGPLHAFSVNDTAQCQSWAGARWPWQNDGEGGNDHVDV